MFVLIIISLNVGSIASVPGFSTMDKCQDEGKKLIDLLNKQAPSHQLARVCIKTS
jgi:hypothetical protein